MLFFCDLSHSVAFKGYMMLKLIQKIPTPWLIFFATLFAYLPYLNTRVARMTGDEKVYVSQAVEMYERGAYWTQTLHGQAQYFKGPFHLWAIKLGLFIFGNQLIAGLWIHLALLLVACLLLHRSLRNLTNEPIANWVCTTSILSLGVFSHAYASQMEAELVAFSLILLSILIDPRSKTLKTDLPFWILCGLGGWIKSPLYSLLWGISGVLFWGLEGSLLRRLKSVQSWLEVIAGVLICTSGYLPSYLLDSQNFLETYIYREQLNKSGNGESWSYVWKSLIHFTVPFLFWTLGGIFLFFRNYRKILSKPEFKRLFYAAISLFLPSALFFSNSNYKGQNYLLPYLCCFFILASLGWFFPSAKTTEKNRLFKLSFVPNVFGILTVVFVLVFLVMHFAGTDEFSWMIRGTALPILFLCISAYFFFSANFQRILLATVFFFLSFSSLAYFLGDRELWPMRTLLADFPDSPVVYAVSGDNIFSEWALMRLALRTDRIEVISGQNQIRARMETQGFLPTLWVAQTPEDDVFLKQLTDKLSPTLHTSRIPWKKWLTKAGGQNREIPATIAWTEKTLSPFQRNMWVYVTQKLN